MDILQIMKRQFDELFSNVQETEYFFSPGRINLIGEHTDYNGGHVFPAAISYGTHMLISKRQDKKIHFYSMNFKEKGRIELALNDLNYRKEDGWTNYPKGMIKLIMDKGYHIDKGFNVLFYGDIPNGAGLSSSASIEMAMGVGLNDVFNLNIPKIDLVKIGQAVENNYIGVSSGIMDQFAICMGQKEHAILLNCDSLDYEYAPLKLTGYEIIIMNTNMQRTLADSKYNERFSECQTALKSIQKALDINSLGALTRQALEANKDLIQNKTVLKRARHAVTENERTIAALHALKNNNLQLFGKLMNASHVSLRDDYEVTGKALDTIVEAAWQQDGVLGARMTGAGFGGCAIAIVKSSDVSKFKNNVTKVYEEEMNLKPSFYHAKISDGTKKIEMEGSHQ